MTAAVTHASQKKVHAAAVDRGLVVGENTVPIVPDVRVSSTRLTAGSLPSEFP